jgi:hypothetical protein
MQKLSDLVNEKYKTDKTIVGKRNSLPKTKLEENLLTAILKPIGIYFIFTWLGNLAYNFQSYLDGRDYNLSKALRRIVESGINDSNLAKKLDSAYFSGASLNTLVNIYMDSNIIKRNIDKELKKNKDKTFDETQLQTELRNAISKGFQDQDLQNKSMADIEKKLK